MRKTIYFLITVFFTLNTLSLNTLAEDLSLDYLIGDWNTSDGIYLSFYDDGVFTIDWGLFGTEEGNWTADSTSNGSFPIDMEGSSILSMMSLIYGQTISNYHFEVLKCNQDNFYLVQVYGDYSAYTSPCKLGFTRYGATEDFSINSEQVKETIESEGVEETEKNEASAPKEMLSIPSSTENDGRIYTFAEDEKIEDLVLSMRSDTYNPRLSHFLSIMARASYDQNLVKRNLEALGFNTENSLDYLEDYEDDKTAAYSVAKKTIDVDTYFVLITIRGSWGWSWSNNADIGIEALNGLGKHAGFESSARQIYDQLENLMGREFKANAIYVITGHSQGAAVANLLAVKLYDAGISTDKVYNYNFACPNVACLPSPIDWNPKGAHNNIFNIGNVEDPVTFLPSNLIKAFIPRLSPLSTWGKFGRSYWFIPDIQNQSVVGHDMTYYIDALDPENQISDFATYSQIATDSILRVIGVHCPVDIQVSDINGSPIVDIINNKALFRVETSEVFVAVDEDEKYVCFTAGQPFRIHFTGTDKGTMIYEISDIGIISGDVLRNKAFESVTVSKGKKMISDVGGDKELFDIMLQVVNNDDTVIADVQNDGTEIPIEKKLRNSDNKASVPTKGSNNRVLIYRALSGILLVSIIIIFLQIKKTKRR